MGWGGDSKGDGGGKDMGKIVQLLTMLKGKGGGGGGDDGNSGGKGGGKDWGKGGGGGGGDGWNSGGKGGGKDWGKGGGKDWSKGGKGKKGLRGFPIEQKVWVGSVHVETPGMELNKQLQEHMAQAGTCKWAEVGKSGQGGAAYATAEEAQAAIAGLNGSLFNGAPIEVDVWTQKTS